MSKAGKLDGLLLGALLGAILVFPSIGTTILNWVTSIIPATWNWFGATTTKVIVIAAGALVGAIVDMTK